MPQKPNARRIATGIRRLRTRYQAYVRVNGRLHTKSFARATPLKKMQAWRTRTRLEYEPRAGAEGTLAGNVEEYLTRVRAMRTFEERRYHLELWVGALGGHRPRLTISPGEIDRVMQRWLREGLSPNSVKNRRTALLHLWNTLDGRDAQNPVRASQRPSDDTIEARAIPYADIVKIFEHMRPSKTRARLKVIAWTGLPHVLIKEVRPSHIMWKTKQLRTTPRHKGRGANAIIIPLLVWCD